MSAIHLNNRLAHYELVGRRGQPTIFLHSWVGSWRYWLPTMEYVSDKYRAYAFDFWGFGESDRHISEFTIDEYVGMLFQFLQQLGVSRVNLVGHALGGMVAILAAAQRPDMFSKLMVVNTPIQGVQLQAQLKSGAFSRLLGRQHPTNVWAKQMRDLKIDDTDVHREIIEDTEALTDVLVERVISSILNTDLRPQLTQIESPLLAIYGERDTIVDVEQSQLIPDDTGKFQQVLTLHKSNHFPFLDQPNIFNRALVDFLSSDGDPVQLKTEWRRRVSQLEYI